MRLSSLALAPILAAGALAASVCNGDAALCQRSYGNVTYIGAHDSYAVGTQVSANQDKPVKEQLTDGIRALQVQVHNEKGELRLCHSSCGLYDGGLFSDYLKTVGTWMSSNPNDVVTLVIVNIDNVKAADLAAAFQTAGVDKKAYAPTTATMALGDWPTLGALIDAGTTLVSFVDNGADASVPYLVDQFSNMWEDAYDVTDQVWGCQVNRTTGPSPGTKMYMINHFLDTSTNLVGNVIYIPDKSKLNQTNAGTGAGSIGFHVDNCVASWARAPNVVLLDFYDSNGNAPFDYAATLNGVAAPTNVVTPGNPGSATASGGGTAVQTSSIKNSAPALTLSSSSIAMTVVGVVAGALFL